MVTKRAVELLVQGLYGSPFRRRLSFRLSPPHVFRPVSKKDNEICWENKSEFKVMFGNDLQRCQFYKCQVGYVTAAF